MVAGSWKVDVAAAATDVDAWENIMKHGVADLWHDVRDLIDAVRGLLPGKSVLRSMSFTVPSPNKADMVSVICYLRGNKHLEIPQSWREILPRAL